MNSSVVNKLALGTVQFGLNYGINNKTGEIGQEKVNMILNTALESGIDTLDTAHAYGSSEIKIGRFLANTPGNAFKIVSKHPFEKEINPKRVEETLNRLGLDSIYAYLAHDFRMFDNNISKIRQFVDLKGSGKFEKIGFSVYHPEDIRFLLNNKIDFDIIQAPYSVFDQRFEPIFKEMHAIGTEIHSRSCFLQGLAFLQPDALPEKLKGMGRHLSKLNSIAHYSGRSIHSLCLQFCLQKPFIDKVIIGVDGPENLKQNILSASEVMNDDLHRQLTDLKEENETLILPYNW